MVQPVSALEGMASFALPDLILREDEITTALPDLARRMGHDNTPGSNRNSIEPDVPRSFCLPRFMTISWKALAAEAYQRDYLQFGFGAWTPLRGAE